MAYSGGWYLPDRGLPNWSQARLVLTREAVLLRRQELSNSIEPGKQQHSPVAWTSAARFEDDQVVLGESGAFRDLKRADGRGDGL
jgi:hypothetical protein